MFFYSKFAMRVFSVRKANSFRVLAENRGLTLMELLISFTILAIMMAVIMGGFRVGIRAWQRGEAKADYNQKLRVVMDHMIEDIRSAHSRFIVDEKDDSRYHAFWGESGRIRFLTTAVGLQSEPGLSYTRAVEYFVEPGTGLMTREVPCLGGDCFEELADQDPVLLDSNVDELTFRYCYIPEPEPGEEGEGDPECEWVDDWDPTQKDDAVRFSGGTAAGDSFAAGGGKTEKIPVEKLPNAVELTISLEFIEENRTRQMPPLYVPIYLGQVVALPKEKS